MGGDLHKWKGSDIATSPSVQFFRKGGWFISKGFVALLMAGFVTSLVVAVFLTKYFTEAHLKNTSSVKPSEITVFPIVPLSYELLLNHSSDAFSGEMKMKFKSINDTSQLNLKFMGTSVSLPSINCADGADGNGSDLNVSLDYNKEKNTVIITSSSLIHDKECTLQLNFEGTINPEEKGIFKIPYKINADNSDKYEDRWIIGANLAPTYCSRVFPCFEDSFERSKFRLKLIRPENVYTVSNAFSKADRILTDNPESQMDDYQWTPSLPVSSISYFILPEYKVKTVSGPTRLNIWYPLHLENSTDSLANLTSSILGFYENYFQTQFHIKNLSLVIVDGLISDLPGMFGIVPISSKVLYSVERKTLMREENLFHYLGQKLCDIWLGNIVNFKSWSDYWIQEGFCIYMSYVAAENKFEQRYRPLPFLLLQEKALHEGSYEHPMPVGFLRDNEEKITLPNKGAFIFSMVQEILGYPTFEKGIKKFFKNRLFSPSEPHELWEAFNAVQNETDVLKFVDTWKVDQYPLVKVEKKSGEILLQQVPSGSHLWSIPISYISIPESIPNNDGIMNEEFYKVKMNSDQSRIIVNPVRSGFYRANYSAELWSGIIKDLKNDSKQFPTLVKEVLIDDAFSLAELGELNYGVALNLSLYLRSEIQPAPWISAMKHFNFISFFFEGSEDEVIFKDYLEELISKGKSAIDSRKTTAERKKTFLEIEQIHWSCKYSITDNCSFEKQFNDWSTSREMINKDLPSLDSWKYAFCYGVRDGIIENGTIIDELMTNESRKLIAEPYEEFNMLTSLTCTRDPEILIRVLDQSLNTSNPFFSPKRTIELWLSLKEITMNSRAAFAYVKENWSSIYNRFKREGEILRAILEGSTYALIEENDLEEVKKLRELSEGTYMRRVFNNIEENLKHHLQWKKSCLEVIKNWLRNNNNVAKNESNSTSTPVTIVNTP